MRTSLVVGDWSKDGHSITEVTNVDHNLASSTALKKAFEAGEKLVGIKYEEIARDYQESYIGEDAIEKLVAAGLLVSFTPPGGGDAGYQLTPGPVQQRGDMIYTYGDRWHINEELFVDLWMRIALLGEPTLIYAFPKNNYSDRINIGGYGFFE